MIMKQVIKALAVFGAVVVARLLPLSPIIGSWHAAFSWSTIAAPVVASQCGLFWVMGFLFSHKLLLAPSMMLFVHRAPLLLAACVFQKRNVLLTVCVPLICMMLFMIHPVGAKAWHYALYWLIPVALFAVRDVLWTRALQASFVAHAVGSIIWLYSGSITPEIWLSLIPIVACERLLIAAGIVVSNEFCNVVVVWYYSCKKYLSGHKAIE